MSENIRGWSSFFGKTVSNTFSFVIDILMCIHRHICRFMFPSLNVKVIRAKGLRPLRQTFLEMSKAASTNSHQHNRLR